MQTRNQRCVAQSARLRSGAQVGLIILSSLLAGCQSLDIDNLFDKPQPAQQIEKKQPRKAIAKAPRGAQTATVTAEDARDPVKAKALRAQALEQMNNGAIDAAAANLKRASELDPGNEAIRKDLDRALRIQSTVSARAQ